MRTVINHVNVLDVETGRYTEDTSVLIVDQVIEGIGNFEEADQVIDGQGKYLLPGMIDSHVHLMVEFKPLEERLVTPFSYNFYQGMAHAKTTLDAGITTVRDALGADLGFKKAIQDKLFPGPRTQISVNALTITGGHGDGYQYSGNTVDLLQADYPGMPSGICDGVEEVRKKTREMLRAGADVIKVHATGGVSSPTDHPNFTQFSLDELKVMVEEAKFRNNVKVMAHAQGLEGIKQCVEAGIHSIEHGIYLDEEVVQQMKEKGTFLVPTLLAPISVLEFAEELGIPQVAIQKSQEVLEDHITSFQLAHRNGVKIAMGTDAGVFKHGTNLRELADVILVDVDPLEDIGSLKNNDNIRLVVKDGDIVKNTL